jgi:hypothetical protein
MGETLYPESRPILASELSSAFIAAARVNAEHLEPGPAWTGLRPRVLLEPERIGGIRAVFPDVATSIGPFADDIDVARAVFPDVEASVERFALQERALRSADLPTPVAHIADGAVPIDIGLDLARRVSGNVLSEIVYRFQDPPPGAPDRPSSLHTSVTNPDQAADGLQTHLTQFLSARLSAHGGGHQPRAPLAAGYAFEVSTDTAGLRIHYSPAYFVNTNLVFGAPTPHVKGCLQPGRYIFGAYPVGYWDNAQYDVPGPTNQAHLNI